MTRLLSAIALAALFGLSACAGGAVRWQPSLVSHVPDSTPVRFAPSRNEPQVEGLALDWQRGRPKLVTERGDTLVIPDASRLEVRLREKASHPTAGAVIGWAIGVGISYATCPAPKRRCGEEDPTPMLTAGLGALIGSKVKTDWWVGVRWDAPTRHE